jgi:hypothetical protein
VKLDPGTHKGNAFSFSLKTGCDTYVGRRIRDGEHEL